MKKLFVYFTIFAALIVFSYSCNIDNSNTNPPNATFAYVQASPDAGNLDVYANGGVIALNFPYTHDTGYYLAQPGIYDLKAAQTGTFNYLVDQNITFEAGKAYSVFTIDSASKMKVALVSDSLNAPSTDSPKIRFFNFSPNEGSVDLGISGVGTPWYTSRTFNDQATTTTYQNFVTIPAGTYNLQALQAGTSNIEASAPSTVLTGGKIYTIYLKGFKGGTGAQELGIGTVVHNE